MRNLRTVVGALLIIAAIVGMVLWESKGREAFLMERVLVAKQPVAAGTIAEKELFRTALVLKENVAEGAVTPERFSRIRGKSARHLLAGNQQVTDSDFLEPNLKLKEGMQIFPIMPEWIALRSSSLRRKDYVDIYVDSTGEYVGTYQLAFVKDAKEREVVGEAGDEQELPLQRISATGQISHVEIITTLSEFRRIQQLQAAHSTEDVPGQFLLVGATGGTIK